MKNLYKSLAAFQSEVPTIKKNSSGYGYKFADLEEITNVIKPLMSKHGLGYAQPLDGTQLKTIVFHVESGESIESSVDLPQDVQLKGQNTFQTIGSGITYFRRYSLSSMLGLVTDEDADAAGEQIHQPVKQAIKTEPVVAPITSAKTELNDMLENYGYNNTVKKKAFILKVLGKSTVESVDEADQVMTDLTNVQTN